MDQQQIRQPRTHFLGNQGTPTQGIKKKRHSMKRQYPRNAPATLSYRTGNIRQSMPQQKRDEKRQAPQAERQYQKADFGGRFHAHPRARETIASKAETLFI